MPCCIHSFFVDQHHFKEHSSLQLHWPADQIPRLCRQQTLLGQQRGCSQPNCQRTPSQPHGRGLLCCKIRTDARGFGRLHLRG